MSSAAFRSFTDQGRRYFSRPHENIPETAIATPAAWYGSEMAAHPERWLVQLSASEVAEVERAARALVEAGVPRLYLPRGLGGYEVSPVLCAEICETLADADPSAAWFVMLAAPGMLIGCLFLAFSKHGNIRLGRDDEGVLR